MINWILQFKNAYFSESIIGHINLRNTKTNLIQVFTGTGTLERNNFISADVAEWLRRLTRNQFLSEGVGSNPTICERFLFLRIIESKKKLENSLLQKVRVTLECFLTQISNANCRIHRFVTKCSSVEICCIRNFTQNHLKFTRQLWPSG